MGYKIILGLKEVKRTGEEFKRNSNKKVTAFPREVKILGMNWKG